MAAANFERTAKFCLLVGVIPTAAVFQAEEGSRAHRHRKKKQIAPIQAILMMGSVLKLGHYLMMPNPP